MASVKEMRFIDMANHLEEIIEIFRQFPDGLTTQEIYEQMQVRYGYNQTKENLDRTYLKLLENGAVKGVTFKRVFRGKHKLIDNRFENLALDKEKKAYIKLALETVEDLNDISRHHKDVCRKLNLNELELPFYIKPEAYQHLNTDEEEIGNLEEAILGDYLIEFRYKEKWYHVAPYRLVNFDGIWYLYGKDMEESSQFNHKTWMLEFIDDVTVFHSERHDTPDREIDEDLENAYGAKFVPDQQIKMLFFVDNSVAELFGMKSHFPKQKRIREEEQGVVFESTVSHFDEIKAEVKSWIPHIRILEPHDWQETIEAELRAYLS